MPTCKFLNKKTNKEFDTVLTTYEKEYFLKINKNLEDKSEIGTFFIGDPIRQGIRKTPSGFTEVLSRIKSNNHKSTITTGNLTTI